METEWAEFLMELIYPAGVKGIKKKPCGFCTDVLLHFYHLRQSVILPYFCPALACFLSKQFLK